MRSTFSNIWGALKSVLLHKTYKKKLNDNDENNWSYIMRVFQVQTQYWSNQYPSAVCASLHQGAIFGLWTVIHFLAQSSYSKRRWQSNPIHPLTWVTGGSNTVEPSYQIQWIYINTVRASGDTLRPAPFTCLTPHRWAYGCSGCPQAKQQEQIRARQRQPLSRVMCSTGMMWWPRDRQLWLWGQPDWHTHIHTHTGGGWSIEAEEDAPTLIFLSQEEDLNLKSNWSK